MMEAMPAKLQFSIGVIIERRRAKSPWLDFIFAPVMALPGNPDTTPWTLLFDDGETARFFCGCAEVSLYRTETNHYRENLLSSAPSIWVVLRPTGSEPPYSLVTATVDPAEGESFTQARQDLVGAIPIPPVFCEMIEAFTKAHPVQPQTYKRRRDAEKPARVDAKGDIKETGRRHG